jgi:hypothetical protein
MTRSELETILSRGRIFCDLWVVAYFLGLTWNQADHMYRCGRLPKVVTLNGTEWRPAGTRLVLVERFAEMVPGERQSEFSLWRRGGFDLPPYSGLDVVRPLLEHVYGSVDLPVGVTARP